MIRNSDGTFAKSYETRMRDGVTPVAAGTRTAHRDRATDTWYVMEVGKGRIAEGLTREDALTLMKENR